MFPSRHIPHIPPSFRRKLTYSIITATISAPPAGEDEIDWDEDDTKATTAPAAAAIAAGGQGPVATPAAVPNQVHSTDPTSTSDLKVIAPSATITESKSTTETIVTPTAEAAKPAEPKQDFSAKIPLTDAEKEAIKRAERAKKFGVVEPVMSEEEKKKAERAKKFGLSNETVDVQGLDSALPDKRERQPKRGREEQGGRNGGAKRQNNGGGARNGAGRGGVGGGNGFNRRNGGGGGDRRGGGGGGGGGRKITDDPTERAKAEARALKFKS